MNIQLINQESLLKKNLQPDKIVNVKVIKIEENKATIEINGQKAQAAVNSDIPDNFFALVESGIDDNGRQIFKLRVIGSLINAEYLQGKKEASLLENIKNILIENNLPLKDSFFQTALKMHQSGLKLNKDLLKFLHLASIKYSQSYADLFINFFRNGLSLDMEFIDFFSHLKKILKLYIQNLRSKSLSKDEKISPDENQVDHIHILEGLFQAYFGKESAFGISYLQNNKEDIPVLQRKEKKADKERFYFDCSSEKTGGFIIILDKFENGYDVNVYLETSYLERFSGEIKDYAGNISPALSRKLNNKKIIVAFHEFKNPNLFWIKDKDRPENTENRDLFNLDISA